MQRDIRKLFKTKENENTAYPNLWDIAKAVLKAKVIVVNIFIKKEEKSQTT